MSPTVSQSKLNENISTVARVDFSRSLLPCPQLENNTSLPLNDCFPRQYHLDTNATFSFPFQLWPPRIWFILYFTSAEAEMPWLAGKKGHFHAQNPRFHRCCWSFLAPNSTSVCHVCLHVDSATYVLVVDLPSGDPPAVPLDSVSLRGFIKNKHCMHCVLKMNFNTPGPCFGLLSLFKRNSWKMVRYRFICFFELDAFFFPKISRVLFKTLLKQPTGGTWEVGVEAEES